MMSLIWEAHEFDLNVPITQWDSLGEQGQRFRLGLSGSRANLSFDFEIFDELICVKFAQLFL